MLNVLSNCIHLIWYNYACIVFFLRGLLEVVRDYGLPESFIGVILLPIAGNACEHAGTSASLGLIGVTMSLEYH